MDDPFILLVSRAARNLSYLLQISAAGYQSRTDGAAVALDPDQVYSQPMIGVTRVIK